MSNSAQPAQTPVVHVVTLTWNQRDDAIRCLESLHGMIYPNLRFLLVDNASSDGTAEEISRRFPDVNLIVNRVNLGFSGGFNVGIRHLLHQGAEYLFMVNIDTTVAPDIVTKLMASAMTPGVGMVGPKIYRSDDTRRIWSVGGNRNRFTYEMTQKGDGQLDRGQWDTPLDRDYLVGCALLLRREMLETVGLFDERFRPIYYEDSDLCLRARRAGFRLLLVPSAQMWHKGVSSSGGRDSPRHRYLMGRNSVLYFHKHIHGWHAPIVIAYRAASALKVTCILLLRGRWASTCAYWKGLRDGLRSALIAG